MRWPWSLVPDSAVRAAAYWITLVTTDVSRASSKPVGPSIRAWRCSAIPIRPAEFEREQGIDPTRPRTAPVAWHHTLELVDALAFAQRSGKPFLVEWSNDACPWCKRLAWSTYGDAAVVRRMQDFACVRIDRDLEPTGAPAKLGVQACET
jgi:thiol:disulfide interchange protein